MRGFKTRVRTRPTVYPEISTIVGINFDRDQQHTTIYAHNGVSCTSPGTGATRSHVVRATLVPYKAQQSPDGYTHVLESHILHNDEGEDMEYRRPAS